MSSCFFKSLTLGSFVKEPQLVWREDWGELRKETGLSRVREDAGHQNCWKGPVTLAEELGSSGFFLSKFSSLSNHSNYQAVPQ